VKKIVSAPFVLLLAVLVICLAADTSAAKLPNPSSPLKRVWQAFCHLHFGWQMAITLWVTIMCVKAFC
jgi:ABC-type nitrate/sulfonate/bicarbonate transport system permease component